MNFEPSLWDVTVEADHLTQSLFGSEDTVKNKKSRKRKHVKESKETADSKKVKQTIDDESKAKAPSVNSAAGCSKKKRKMNKNELVAPVILIDKLKKFKHVKDSNKFNSMTVKTSTVSGLKEQGASLNEQNKNVKMKTEIQRKSNGKQAGLTSVDTDEAIDSHQQSFTEIKLKKKKRKRKCQNKFKDCNKSDIHVGEINSEVSSLDRSRLTQADTGCSNVSITGSKEQKEFTNNASNIQFPVANSSKITSNKPKGHVEDHQKGNNKTENLLNTNKKMKEKLSVSAKKIKKTPNKAHKFDPDVLRSVLFPAKDSDLKDNVCDVAVNAETNKEPKSLFDKCRERLNAARFRYLNEQLYSTTGREAFKMFVQDEEAFNVYHRGYQSQVSKWPTNPLDIIIQQIKAKPKHLVIADFGCGDAKLARSVPQKVHSFDFVALNDLVTVCDMSKVSLKSSTVDIAVFSLSLMGTNIVSYLLEANRVLKIGGTMKIAEVTSRFDSVGQFILAVEKIGFKILQQDLKNKMFVLMDFRKTSDCTNKSEIAVKLKPCIYKKR